MSKSETRLKELKELFDKLTNTVKNNEKELRKLDNKPYREVKDEYEQLAETTRRQKNKLIRLEEEIKLYTELNELNEGLNNIHGRNIFYSLCLVEHSCDFNFKANASFRVLYDLTLNKTISGQELDDILTDEGFKDHECASATHKMICLKIGGEYFIKAN